MSKSFSVRFNCRPSNFGPLAGLVLVVLAGAAGCASSGSARGGSGSDSDSESTSGTLVVGEPMPDLVVDEFWKGDKVRLSDLKGKVVLLDIWASWCAPCKEEMPILDAMAPRLRKKGVQILAISIDEERANAEQFLKSRKRWAITIAHDPDGKVPDRLQPPKMPTSYVIDREGVLRGIHAGFEPDDAADLEAELSALAAGK